MVVEIFAKLIILDVFAKLIILQVFAKWITPQVFEKWITFQVFAKWITLQVFAKWITLAWQGSSPQRGLTNFIVSTIELAFDKKEWEEYWKGKKIMNEIGSAFCGNCQMWY